MQMEEVGSLLAFKDRVWNDPTATLSSWNPNHSHPCSWTGVSCTSGTYRVNSLSLAFRNLSGHLGAELGRLSHLQYLNISGNALTGGIPPELGRLKGLMVLDLSFNQLQFQIPVELGQCVALKVMSAGYNNLNGSIPASLGNLTNLTSLQIQKMVNLTGRIPSEFGKLQNLRVLYLWGNNLSGVIPRELGKLENLLELRLGENQLTGNIPVELGNLKNLQLLSLGRNNLTGVIPREVGNLENLRMLYLWGNNLSGAIPRELGKLENLLELEFGQNQLTGNIPRELGNLENLQMLYLWGNNLSGVIPRELGKLENLLKLRLGENQLTGNIPVELGNLKNLQLLYLGRNNLTGVIPRELGNLENLLELYLSHNHLTGEIPRELCQLKILKTLHLENNALSGEIPYEIKSLRNLFIMSASTNKLTGSIPTSFGDLSSLVFLNLGHNWLNGSLPKSWRQRDKLRVLLLQENHLEGSLPVWIWRLSKLQVLDLSDNLFTGDISTEISQLQAFKEVGPIISKLLYDIFTQIDFSSLMIFYFKENEQAFPHLYRDEGFLNLAGNHLDGGIPTELGFLQGIRSLNLSSNKLVGHIPRSLGNISNLESLDLRSNLLDGRIPEDLRNINSSAVMNLSYNNLSGSIPTGRQFNTFDNSSYIGNINLCGFPLSKRCEALNKTVGIENRTSSQEDFSEKTRLIVIVVPVVGILFLLSLIFWFYGMQSVISPAMDIHLFGERLKVNATVSYNATDGYSDSSIIGRGATSTVYKGTLDNGQLVAIKKLHMGEQNEEVERCFRTECKTLGQVRHRNLVKILGAISDGSTKMLVLQFIPNGSLDMHLHNSEICHLTWETRLKIGEGIAQALVYLHERSGRGQIIHCDLKPSNILLDENFEAYVNDFGIARLVDAGVSGSTLSSTFRGSIGYIAPEFAYGHRVSAKADVYSYGVVLLEMITRKRPTSSAFVGQNSLVEWVSSLFPEKAITAIDDALQTNATSAIHEQISSVIGLALRCTQATPSDRPSMREVQRILADIKGGHHQTLTNINSEHMNRIMYENVGHGGRTGTSSMDISSAATSE